MTKINLVHLLDVKWLLIVGVLLSSAVFSLGPVLVNHPEVAIGITLDLTIVIPLVYFWIIRKKNISNFSIIPVFLICLLLASFLLPPPHHHTLQWIKTWLLPVVELSALSFLIYKIRQIWIQLKKEKTTNPDFLDVLYRSTRSVFGTSTLAGVLSTELAVFYYTFYFGKKRKADQHSFFSYHKKSGQTEVLGVICFLLIVETIPVHILLAMWNETIAWIASLSSLYLMLQIFAHLRASRLRFIEFQENHLIVRNGLAVSTQIKYEHIDRLEVTTRSGKTDKKVVKVGFLPELESHNMKLLLKEPQLIRGLYGKEKKVQILLFFIDDKEAFLQKFNSKVLGHEKSAGSKSGPAN